MQFSGFKSRFNRLVRGDGSSAVQLQECLESNIVLQSLLLAKLNRDIQHINSLVDMEFSGFSQWGEDGILDWIINKIPMIPDSLVEFGVGDYHESNTRLLLYLRNWRGLVLDGSVQHIDYIKKQDIFWKFDLTARQVFIDCDNINDVIAFVGFSGEIGF